MPTLIGVLDDRNTTEKAVETLIQNGFDRHSIGVMWRDRSVDQTEEIEVISYRDHHDDAGGEAGKGAVGGAFGGAAAGAGTVLLASAGVALIPGIGALLAAGTAAAAAVAAAAGAVSGGLAGGLLGAVIGAGDDEATKVSQSDRRYRSALERDGFVITVSTDEESVPLARDVLETVGADDVSILRGQVAADNQI